MNKLLECQNELAKVLEYSKELENQISIKNKEVEYFKNNDDISKTFNNSALTAYLKEENNRYFFLLNIDNFSNVNNSYGFETGNKLLEEVVKLIRMIMPSDSKLFRFFGDKFVLAGSSKRTEEELVSIAQEILSFFNACSVSVDDDIDVQVSFSIGISNSPGLRGIYEAELALKKIRNSRRNYYSLYSEELGHIELEKENIYWINKIKDSILEDHVIVYFQPILNNKTKKIEKYECLSRVNDDGVLVSPFKFMKAAIETRVLHLMTQSVIRQACKKFSNTDYEFSINITKDDLFMNYLEAFLLKKCLKHNIKPSNVIVEILEDITTLNEDNIILQLDSLRDKGFKIAIDDFGAEKSNFSRLLEFKPDYLKIDGAFIKNIVEDKNSRLITESISHICKESGIKVIAEFTHNKEVQAVIEEIGIDYSQGYYIGAPSTDIH